MVKENIKHFIIGVLLFFSPQISTAQTIEHFHSDIVINKDGSVIVEETIDVDFTGAPDKKGIYRYIPYIYKGTGGKVKIPIEILSVSHNVHDQYQKNNNFILQIGSPDRTANIKEEYIIKYKFKYLVNEFPEYDELFLNVTGNAWDMLIKKVSVDLKYEKPVNDFFKGVICFVGEVGSKNESCGIYKKGNGLYISSVLPLYTNEGLTIAVSFQKGLLENYVFVDDGKSVKRSLKNLDYSNYIYNLYWGLSIAFFIILIFGFVIYICWKKYGKSPDLRTIIPHYKVKYNMTPALFGTILDDKVNDIDITSVLIHLALKGVIKIKKNKLKSYDFVLLAKDFRDKKDLFEHEKLILGNIFNMPGETKKSLKSLKGNFSLSLDSIKDQVYTDTVSLGFFTKDPRELEEIMRILSIGLLIAISLTGLFIDMPILQFISMIILTGLIARFIFLRVSIFKFILGGGLFAYFLYIVVSIAIVVYNFEPIISTFIDRLKFNALVFNIESLVFYSLILISLFGLFISKYMSQKTKKGMRAFENVLGIKEFIITAEKDRIKFYDEKKLFVDLLPFAMIFGLSKQWSKLFSGLTIIPVNLEGFSDNVDEFIDEFNYTSEDLSRGLGIDTKHTRSYKGSSISSIFDDDSDTGWSGGSGVSSGSSGGGFGGGGGSSW